MKLDLQSLGIDQYCVQTTSINLEKKGKTNFLENLVFAYVMEAHLDYHLLGHYIATVHGPLVKPSKVGIQVFSWVLSCLTVVSKRELGFIAENLVFM